MAFRFMTVLLGISSLKACLCISAWRWLESDVNVAHGHYPPSYLTLSNVVLNGSDGIFHYNSPKNLLDKVNGTTEIWQFKAGKKDDLIDEIRCDMVFEEGHAFTIFYFGGESNYFHLHYDVMMPLFSAVYRNKPGDIDIQRVFMPTVESGKLQALDWMTPAFDHSTAIWNEMTLVMVGKHKYLPLNKSIRNSKMLICYNKIHFGTVSSEPENPGFMAGFRQVVYKHLNLSMPTNPPLLPRVGIIGRATRRRIVNEKELVGGLNMIASTDILQFDKMSFKQQVEAMSQYAVVVGMVGAGLMNCLYLPPSSVCVQLVPLHTHGHHVDFGHLLKARGPYLEWRNSHNELHHDLPGDTYHVVPDTTVHVKELQSVVQKALEMVYGTIKNEL